MDYDIGKAFSAIEDELIASMMRNMERHVAEETAEGFQWEMWQALQLRSLEEYRQECRNKFGGIFSDINGRLESAIREAETAGAMVQETEILKAIKKGFKAKKPASDAMQAEFFRLNKRKLEALIKATKNDMEKAEHAILRKSEDAYRKAIFNAQAYANSGAGTYEKAVDMATKDMLSSGLRCVQYKDGPIHTLADYADMAVKTASKRAYLQGEGEARQKWGISTVIMNKRGNPCPKCLPFCGKILIDDVWSGGTPDGRSPVTGEKYPLMSEAIAAGLYHPRCRDSHTTYFEGVSSPPETKYTRKELDGIADAYRAEQRLAYARKQAERYERMEKYSLDGDNRERYRARAEAWRSELAIDIDARNDILKPNRRFKRRPYLKTGNMSPDEYARAKDLWRRVKEVDIPQAEKERIYEELDNNLTREEKESAIVRRPIGNHYYTAVNLGHNQYKIYSKQPIDGRENIVDEVLSEMFGYDWKDLL